MTRPLHVLAVVGNAIVGGMESYVTHLARWLPADSFKTTFLCPFESAFTQKLRDSGHKVYLTPIGDDPSWISIQFTANLVQQLHIDVMHAHLSNAHLLASVCSALTHVPTLATVHGRNLSLMDFEVYRLGCSHLTVVCQNAYQHALRLGVNANDLTFVPNGVDVEAFASTSTSESLQASLGLKPGTLLVGFVGRLAAEKNPLLFIQTAVRVHLQYPDVHFVLIGDGPLRDASMKLITQLDASKYIHLPGVWTDMPAAYACLEMLVMTSDSEGMPLALMEAMAAGRATITTHVGGIGDIVVAGQTGLLAAPGHLDALVDQVNDLLQKPDRRRRMGVAGQRRVRTTFAIERTATLMADVLRSTASDRPALELPHALHAVDPKEASAKSRAARMGGL